MQFLVQAYAPLTVDQVEGGQRRRFLYVFGCTDEECGRQPGCFRAMRLTLDNTASSTAVQVKHRQQDQDVQQQQATGAAATAAAAASLADDDWGAGGAGNDDWGMGSAGDWKEPGEGQPVEAAASSAAAAFDFGDLNAALDAVTSAAAAAAPKPRQAAGSGGGGGTPGQPVYAAGQPCLPAFYLYAEPEAQCSKSGASGGGGQEREHLAALMARYDAEAAAAVDAAAEAAPPPSAAALAAGACTPGGAGGAAGSDAAETWGGEGYEEDAVLAPAGAGRRAAGAAYLKFSKQVARCPDQCARYRCGCCRAAAAAGASWAWLTRAVAKLGYRRIAWLPACLRACAAPAGVGSHHMALSFAAAPVARAATAARCSGPPRNSLLSRRGVLAAARHARLSCN